MTIANIIRAWEDPAYRKSLSVEELAQLPENPVGHIELTEDELSEVVGARSGASHTCNTFCCVSTRGQTDHCCR
jgi:mersacidin/lichenicidin family type 2 lantibiotic